MEPPTRDGRESVMDVVSIVVYNVVRNSGQVKRRLKCPKVPQSFGQLKQQIYWETANLAATRNRNTAPPAYGVGMKVESALEIAVRNQEGIESAHTPNVHPNSA